MHLHIYIIYAIYIKDTPLRVKVTESLDHLGQWYYKSLIINYLSVVKKWSRRGFALDHLDHLPDLAGWLQQLNPVIVLLDATHLQVHVAIVPVYRLEAVRQA